MEKGRTEQNRERTSEERGSKIQVVVLITSYTRSVITLSRRNDGQRENLTEKERKNLPERKRKNPPEREKEKIHNREKKKKSTTERERRQIITCFCKWLSFPDREKRIPTICSRRSLDSPSSPTIDDVDAFRDSFKFSCEQLCSPPPEMLPLLPPGALPLLPPGTLPLLPEPIPLFPDC